MFLNLFLSQIFDCVSVTISRLTNHMFSERSIEKSLLSMVVLVSRNFSSLLENVLFFILKLVLF